MLENAIEEKQVEEIAVRWVFKLKLASDWVSRLPKRPIGLSINMKTSHRRSTSSNSLSSRIKVIADNDVTSI